MKTAGINALAINCSYDPDFKGRGPEPKEGTLKGLSELVVENSLDFGVAFDADGDRAIFVDDKGNVIRGDVALALFVKHLAKPSDKIIFEISCSKVVEDMISYVGATPVPSRIGSRFILEAMEQEKARMGGEISSHIYFSEIYNADDALFSTLRMSGIVASTGSKLSDLIAEMPHYELAALEIPAGEHEKYVLVESAKKKAEEQGLKTIMIDGVKVISSKWRFVIRPSNTTPMIRLIAEGETKQDLNSALSRARSLLGK